MLDDPLRSPEIKRFRAKHSRENGVRLEWQIKGKPTTFLLDDEVIKPLVVTGKDNLVVFFSETTTHTLTTSNDSEDTEEITVKVDQ